MQLIKSFKINHLKLKKGLYLSGESGGIITVDLRIRAPYTDPLLDSSTVHSLEHCLASLLRESKQYGDKVVYVGPMGCRTGFYCLFKDIGEQQITQEIKRAFKFLAEESYGVPGNSREECGNCLDLNAEACKKVAEEYYRVIKDKTKLDSYLL